MLNYNDLYSIYRFDILFELCFVLNYAEVMHNVKLTRIGFPIGSYVGTNLFNNSGTVSFSQEFNL